MMAVTRLIFTAILISTLGAFAQKDPQDCKEKRMPSFSRIMTLTYDGPNSLPASRDDVERVLGECKNVNDFIKDMLDFFSSFGFDTSDVNLEQNPIYTGRVFNVTLYVNEHPSNRVILNSFYEFGEYLDAQVFSVSGNLATNIGFSMRESGQFVAPGSIFSYGISRQKISQNRMCIVSHTPAPLVGSFNGKDYYIPYEFALYDEIWGNGRALGTLKLTGASNFTRSISSSIAFFPPEDRNRRVGDSEGRIST